MDWMHKLVGAKARDWTLAGANAPAPPVPLLERLEILDRILRDSLDGNVIAVLSAGSRNRKLSQHHRPAYDDGLTSTIGHCCSSSSGHSFARGHPPSDPFFSLTRLLVNPTSSRPPATPLHPLPRFPYLVPRPRLLATLPSADAGSSDTATLPWTRESFFGFADSPCLLPRST